MRECTRPHKLNTAVQRRVWAAQKDTAGHMWPAGHSLPTPKLEHVDEGSNYVRMKHQRMLLTMQSLLTYLSTQFTFPYLQISYHFIGLFTIDPLKNNNTGEAMVNTYTYIAIYTHTYKHT